MGLGKVSKYYTASERQSLHSKPYNLTPDPTCLLTLLVWGFPRAHLELELSKCPHTISPQGKILNAYLLSIKQECFCLQLFLQIFFILQDYSWHFSDSVSTA